MILPIHPNTAHLVGPSPFVNDEDPEHIMFELPFKNCFFWVEGDMVLRVRARHGSNGYDNCKAVTMSMRQHLRMVSSFVPHLSHISVHLQQQPQDSHPSHPPTAARAGSPSMPPNASLDDDKGLLPAILDADDMLDGRAEGSVSDPSPTSEPPPELSPLELELEELFSMNLFGWNPDPATKYLPLVNYWFELEEHLSKSTTPTSGKSSCAV
ncbi:hypothetical protein LXA43DRAFT_1104070 [Ganoderma leucocontextum]|nr:hypothetical protein LXA43DRAFT_1104070 [Ganoderma leucocontextum]